MKRILFIIVLVASLFVIRNLVVSIYSLWQKQDLIVQTQEQLKAEKEKNKELKEKIDQTKSVTFIEEEARNKLFMVREGEQEVLISKSLLEPDSKSEAQVTKPNWQQWADLLF